MIQLLFVTKSDVYEEDIVFNGMCDGGGNGRCCCQAWCGGAA
jgi:hypothetical protein